MTMRAVFFAFAATFLSPIPCSLILGSDTVIPRPAKMANSESDFPLTQNTRIFATKPLLRQAQLCAEVFKKDLGLALETVEVADGESHPKGISLELSEAPALPEEGYTLNVVADGVRLVARTPRGLAWGIQSMRQLATGDKDSFSIAGVEITDRPRFPWRGLMLDTSRTFVPMDDLKKYVDVLSFYKMNTLHLHLSDDQGWRMEIKKYPRLTTVGAKFHDSINEPAEFSGFYSQAEMRELVAYAELRGVDLVPEIDMPGHSWAAAVAYPELSTTGKSKDGKLVPFLMRQGVITDTTLDPTNPQVYQFIADVLDELVTVFPSKYIHIGADEVGFNYWQQSERVSQFMKDHNYETFTELQAHFVNRVNLLIRERDRTLIGWDEIADKSQVPDGAVVMAWRSKRWHKLNALAMSTDRGGPVIAASSAWNYLDYTQGAGDNGAERPNPLENTYSFLPYETAPKAKEGQILGINACMWTHMARKPAAIQRMVFPRLLAVAESAWTPVDRKDFASFSRRLPTHYKALAKHGMSYWLDPSEEATGHRPR